MQSTKKMEFWVGLMVLITIMAGLFMALKVSNFGQMAGLQQSKSYQVTAQFTDIGGLKPRAKVSMGGVVVGRVNHIELDPKTFKAVVHIDMDSQFSQIPADSSASILTSGLLGDQYIGIEAGGDDESLIQGSVITYTQPAMVLEKLIGQFLVKLSEK
ncbi:MAG: outer membrane lipid asymmetry maintenance protein MlaD [Gammaproteobacteria bacterium]|nr:outer membrane lipid asymmetry maintenance protein MlaD [Gammaproteobacteria bacterium]